MSQHLRSAGAAELVDLHRHSGSMLAVFFGILCIQWIWGILESNVKSSTRINKQKDPTAILRERIYRGRPIRSSTRYRASRSCVLLLHDGLMREPPTFSIPSALLGSRRGPERLRILYFFVQKVTA